MPSSSVPEPPSYVPVSYCQEAFPTTTYCCDKTVDVGANFRVDSLRFVERAVQFQSTLLVRHLVVYRLRWCFQDMFIIDTVGDPHVPSVEDAF